MPYDVDGHRGRTPTYLGGPRNRKVDESEKKFMRELRDAGVSIREIALRCGRRGDTVVRRILIPGEAQKYDRQHDGQRRRNKQHRRDLVYLWAHTTEGRASRAASMRKQRQRRTAEGRCHSCGASVSGYNYCLLCRERRNQLWREKHGTRNRQTQAA